MAEDHNVVRNGIKSLLEHESDMEVVGDVSNGVEALEAMDDGIHPQIVLVDLSMPEMGGMELIRNMSLSFPYISPIVLSMADHEQYVIEAMAAGARGYLLKNVTQNELVFAIRHVAGGGQYVCSELAIRMILKNASLPDSLQPDITGNFDFTKREMEVLKLISEGYTNNQIADKLFTSRRTVEGHRQSLIEKTGVPNSAALIMNSVRAGILK